MIINNIKVDDMLSMTFDFKVMEVNLTKKFVVVQSIQDGTQFKLCGDDTFKYAMSADYVENVKTLSKTDVCSIICSCKEEPLSIHWTKKNGEVKTIRCKIMDVDDMGYIRVKSLDNHGEIRKIDTRTIRWAIVDGTKYCVTKH